MRKLLVNKISLALILTAIVLPTLSVDSQPTAICGTE